MQSKLKTARRPSSLPSRQRGVVLFVGLIMLLLLTLIGITAMQVTLLQERMAGNFYVQHQGFESGEKRLATDRNSLSATCGAAAGASCPAVSDYFELAAGNNLPWFTWVTSEDMTAVPSSRIYSTSTGLQRYSIATIGQDASGDAKTALQGIYTF